MGFRMDSNRVKKIRNAIAVVGLAPLFLLFVARPFLPLEWRSLDNVLICSLLVLTFGSISVFNKIAAGKFLPGVPARAALRPSELARNNRDRKLGIATGLAIAAVGLVSFVLTKELHWSRSISTVVCVCLITVIVLASYRLRMQNIRRPS
jgi:hypothetical protein